MTNNDYNGDSIKVLKGLDAVRKRPGMYIGDTDDGSGLHHMVFEVVDNSIDEALAGFCKNVNVKIHTDGSVSVSDDGRGIPVDIHPEENVSAAEVVMTVLHAGGKFDANSYKVSGGLHGVGVSVVNALSDKLQLTIKRQGKVWQQIYLDGGKPSAPLKAIGETSETGTEIRFWPSPSIFTITEFKYEILEKRLRELSFLNSSVSINLEDERDGKKELFHYQGGINSFTEFLNKGKTVINKKIFYCSQYNEESGINVEVSLQYTDAYSDTEYCFTNNIIQKDGGTHREGFRRGLTKAIKNYIEENLKNNKKSNSKKDSKFDILTEDCLKGITAVISVKVPDPKFSSQTKDKLVSSEVSSVVNAVVTEKLIEYLNENPVEAKDLVEKIQDEAEIRVKSRSIRENFSKKTLNTITGKLVNCVCKDPSLCELYIVEGDSAGGSAKTGRNAEYQAILPLRGKILNVEKARFDKIISSDTLGTLITALGCGIQEDFSIDNIRYHNVVIMTDADVDGAHIRILLLTFFFRQMPEIIEKGYVYIAQPPLYKYSKGKDNKYILDIAEKNQHEMSLALHNAKLYTNDSTPPIFGEPLEKIFLKFSNLFSIYKRLDVKIPESITKNLVFVDNLSADDMVNEQIVKDWSSNFEKTLNDSEFMGISYKVKVGFNSEKNLFYPIVNMLHFGVNKEYNLSYEFFVGRDYQKISSVGREIEGLVVPGSFVTVGEKKYDVSTFGELHSTLIKQGLNNVKVQRYKGLGEMNAEQLYETTMDPNTRTFLKVNIDDALEANRMFIELMGEEVDPRKVFIAENSHLAEIEV